MTTGRDTATGADTGTYEVLRGRLAAQAGELARGAEALNAARIAAFGSAGVALAGSGHLRTEDARIAADLVAVGDRLLFGYRGTAARGGGTSVRDVLALYDRNLEPLPEDAVPGLLDDPAFRREFDELHRYYHGARLQRLRMVDDTLLAVFRTGEQAEDIRVLRWQAGPAGTVRFLDGRGERDHVFPAAHDVRWREVTRDDHVPGRHPHAAVDGRLYVSTVGGALSIRTEDDTETGAGLVHREPVDESLQSLADAEIAYAVVGPLTLLRVLPYKEETRRHLVFNAVTGTVVRLDGIGLSCRRLPDDGGIVFPGGYCLADGTVRTFDTDTAGLEFDHSVASPNGEDVLFVFQERAGNRRLLLPYSLIRQEVSAPLPCDGLARFEDGTLVVLRPGDGRAARSHAVQEWSTPFTSDTHGGSAAEGPLARIGNPDLVRAVADTTAVARRAAAAGETDASAATQALYESLLADCVRAGDRFPWLAELADAAPGAVDLHAALAAVRATAEQVLAEFEAVRALTAQAADALAEAGRTVAGLLRRIRGEAPAGAEEWIARITELRRAQGHLVTLTGMRYADTGAVEALAAEVASAIGSTAERAMAFLRRADAFDGYAAEARRLGDAAEAITTAAEAEPLRREVEGRVLGLQELTEVASGLEAGDPAGRAGVLERIGEVLGALNQARARLETRRRELLHEESGAEFAAEFALLGQLATGALAAAGTPEECDAQLARLLVQWENLEARFAENEEFTARLAEKRAEVQDAFSARRQSLQDAGARRAESLAASAQRVLETVVRRACTLGDDDAVNTYFSSDPVVAGVRRTVDRLRALGDSVRAEELTGRLAAARQEAGRALRDRAELYADGGGTVRLGRHRFAVTRQTAELTLVPYGDGLAYALTGTDYRRPVADPGFEESRPYWDRVLPSESAQVYRAEYLAARVLSGHGPEALAAAGEGLDALVRRAAEEAYDEGYERGVHDHDAAAILRVLLRLRREAGLLRHPARERAAAALFWAHGPGRGERDALGRRAVSLGRARDLFGAAPALRELQDELARAIGSFGAAGALGADPARAAAYLLEELTCGPEGFALSAAARGLLDAFRRSAGGGGAGAGGGGAAPYDEDLAVLSGLAERRQLVVGWLGAFAAATGYDADPGTVEEAAAAELCAALPRYPVEGATAATVTGLLGTHARVRDRALPLQLAEFLTRTAEFAAADVPGFRAHQRQRAGLLAAERERLRIDAYRPRPMPSFVRNRLIDEVYLPLVGDSLAKQLGAAGDARRTDTHGLLLLLSPPGYGKTSLVEYVAQRLGLLLVKVDGPALGPATTSLDPEAAPDAAARRELEKVAFALEAGNNVLLYLDDIQHTSAELLQQFIPLCDATRTLNGRDLRGKRFAVCMAGNPYTQSGDRFRIPDMLANRADVWNLGDVLTGREEAFAFSFVENALTSHPVLAPLAGRDRADLALLLRLAEGDAEARADRLSHPYAPAEVEEITALLGHLTAARATVLAVNAAYIASAAQDDADRTEPPFRLQGSYRNMNRIAARLSPAMNGAEAAAVVDDHYRAEAQALATGTEANLLKLAALRGALTPEQAARWAEITAPYGRGGAGGGRGGAGGAGAAGGWIPARAGRPPRAVRRPVLRPARRR
ncbi:DNA repair ATPase (plasmid) [Streptomyces globosus]|uniref:DNA repair ATPase n=1 Tax=Streptomyces globosus TaxID=68209 RepID=A0A344UAX8_9ACTN|nr:DNA repair ATPase [Streptomyces globosus]AXE28049.1 DNA repair ATPase [Streptomyces globosus]